MIQIEFTDKLAGTTVRATAPDHRAEEILIRGYVRVHGDRVPTPAEQEAETRRWRAIVSKPVEVAEKKRRSRK